RMWAWSRIGVAAGIGAGIALVAAGWLARSRSGALLAILVGAGAGIAVGFALGDWQEAVGGAVGGLLGGIGGAPLAAGPPGRGGAGTRARKPNRPGRHRNPDRPGRARNRCPCAHSVPRLPRSGSHPGACRARPPT